MGNLALSATCSLILWRENKILVYTSYLCLSKNLNIHYLSHTTRKALAQLLFPQSVASAGICSGFRPLSQYLLLIKKVDFLQSFKQSMKFHFAILTKQWWYLKHVKITSQIPAMNAVKLFFRLKYIPNF